MVQASFYIRINRIYKYLLFYKRTKENLFMKKNKKFIKDIVKELKKNGVNLDMHNPEVRQPALGQTSINEVTAEDGGQEKSYMEMKSQEGFQNDIAFSNWCRRVEALEKRLYKMEKYTVRIDEKVAHVKQQLTLIMNIVRQIGYSAGVVDLYTSNKKMLNKWRKHAKKEIKRRSSPQLSGKDSSYKQWKGGDK